MKEITLGQVQTGKSFWFGGYEFIKLQDSEKDELLHCQIPNQSAFVYISNCALVKTNLIK